MPGFPCSSLTGTLLRVTGPLPQQDRSQCTWHARSTDSGVGRPQVGGLACRARVLLRNILPQIDQTLKGARRRPTAPARSEAEPTTRTTARPPASAATRSHPPRPPPPPERRPPTSADVRMADVHRRERPAPRGRRRPGWAAAHSRANQRPGRGARPRPGPAARGRRGPPPNFGLVQYLVFLHSPTTCSFSSSCFDSMQMRVLAAFSAPRAPLDALGCRILRGHCQHKHFGGYTEV